MSDLDALNAVAQAAREFWCERPRGSTTGIALRDALALLNEARGWTMEPATPRAHPDDGHCPTCICGKRAPVQADRKAGKGPGTIGWEEYLLAWGAYAAKFSSDQSAERIAERAGFSYGELVEFLGGEPKTWRPSR